MKTTDQEARKITQMFEDCRKDECKCEETVRSALSDRDAKVADLTAQVEHMKKTIKVLAEQANEGIAKVESLRAALKGIAKGSDYPCDHAETADDALSTPAEEDKR